MRALVMLLVGMLIGALGAVTAVGAMRKDIPMQKASMTLMRHHFGALRRMGEGQCDAAAMQRHLLALQGLGGAFPAFLPTGGDDAAFERHAANFSRVAEAAVAARPGCDALAATTRDLGGACKACHDDFRD